MVWHLLVCYVLFFCWFSALVSFFPVNNNSCLFPLPSCLICVLLTSCMCASMLLVDLCAFVLAFFPHHYSILSLEFSLHHCWIYIFRQVQTFIVFYRQLVLNKFHRTRPALLIVPASGTKRTLFSVEAMLLATYSKRKKIDALTVLFF